MFDFLCKIHCIYTKNKGRLFSLSPLHKENTMTAKKKSLLPIIVGVLLITVAIASYFLMQDFKKLAGVAEDLPKQISEKLEADDENLGHVDMQSTDFAPVSGKIKGVGEPSEIGTNAEKAEDSTITTPPLAYIEGLDQESTTKAFNSGKKVSSEGSLQTEDISKEGFSAAVTKSERGENIVSPAKAYTPSKTLNFDKIKHQQEERERRQLNDIERLQGSDNSQDFSDVSTASGQFKMNKLESNQDSTITTTFINDLANTLVVRYKQKPTDLQLSDIIFINEKYGSSLTGLKHESGRTGIFSYAYNTRMIKALEALLGPKFKEALIR